MTNKIRCTLDFWGMADNADSGSSSAGYSDSGWESLTSSSSCSSRSDERVVILGSDSYSTSAFEVSVAEASPPAQVNGDYGISSLSRVEGRSSESCRRRDVQGNYEAQIDDRPPQPEALTETDTGVERTEAHRAASNRQCHFTAPASPTEPHQHHQEKGTELSIGSGDLGLGPTTAGIRGQALDSPSPFASATPKLSKPAPRSEENRDLPSRIAKSRSSHAVLFDRDWLDDIKSCRSNGDADTFCLHDEQRQRDQSRKYGLRNTDESRNVVPPGMSAAEIVEGGQRVGAVPAVGASAAGLSGGGEGAESGSGGSQEKKERGQASIGLAYRAWKEEQQSPLLTDVCKKMAESILRQQATGCGGSREASRNFKRPWHPSQWEAFQLQGCPPPPLNCSKITIPRFLIGRVGADAAMERVRFPPPPPPPQASSRDRLEPTLRSKGAERSVRRGTARQEKKAVSAYLSIKAEEIRTRRDHEAWLSRVEGGLDTPIQDPLSLLGGCVESTRRLKETFAVDRMRCGEGVPPRQADSRETEDRSLRPGDCAGGRTSGRDGSSNENSALDDGVAAERRYFLSTPHLEHLVVSSRCLLAEEEERAARESSEQRERRARITGYPFGHGQEIRGSSQVAGGSRETVEAFARRCLAESTKISA